MDSEMKMFEGSYIRSIWDEEKEEWYFSVVDVVAVLTDSKKPRDYWYRVKKKNVGRRKKSTVDNLSTVEIRSN